MRPPHPWATEGRIRCGVYGGLTADWGRNVEWVQLVEALGFDSFWVADHPLTHGRDCWTVLAALAPVTQRLRLGSLVTCALYRPPALLARVVADVDRASGGRAVLGIGMGDHAHEFAQLGLSFPPIRARQRALAEAIEIIQRLWAGEEVTMEGAHFRAAGAVLRPGPVQQPGIPLLLAGGGEQVTLRQVARYADAANFGPGSFTGSAWTLEDVRRKYAVLAEHCAALGRPADTVLRTYAAPVAALEDAVEVRLRRSVTAAGLEYVAFEGTPEAAVAHYRALIAAGVRYFIFVGVDAARLRLLAEQVVPHLVDA